MNVYKNYIILSVLFVLVSISYVSASSPCNPVDLKPPYRGTGIGKMSISPDIVAVGQFMTIAEQIDGGIHGLSINAPTDTEITDYYPKEMAQKSANSVSWSNTGGAPFPAGQYSITVKVNHWTNNQWVYASSHIISTSGTVPAESSYFAYYDTIPLEITLEDRNQVPQPTRDVVRKVSVKGVQDLNITLETNKGEIGTTISDKTGKSATVKANQEGVSVFYIFTKENDKVTLKASSPDTCSQSVKEQEFKIKRSDVSRTYEDKNYTWYIVGGILGLVLLIIVLIVIKRRSKDVGDIDSNSVPPPTQNL